MSNRENTRVKDEIQKGKKTRNIEYEITHVKHFHFLYQKKKIQYKKQPSRTWIFCNQRKKKNIIQCHTKQQKCINTYIRKHRFFFHLKLNCLIRWIFQSKGKSKQKVGIEKLLAEVAENNNVDEGCNVKEMLLLKMALIKCLNIAFMKMMLVSFV